MGISSVGLKYIKPEIYRFKRIIQPKTCSDIRWVFIMDSKKYKESKNFMNIAERWCNIEQAKNAQLTPTNLQIATNKISQTMQPIISPIKKFCNKIIDKYSNFLIN